MSDAGENLPSDSVRAHSTADDAPLRGQTIVVTRPAGLSTHVANALSERGATVVSAPLIRIDPPEDPTAVDRAIERIDSLDWLVFTSANGAARFLDRAAALGRPPDSFPETRIAAVGPATATAVRERGGQVSIVPGRFVAESLADAFRDGISLAGARILVARAAVARDTLPDALRDAGAHVETIDVYQTLANDDEASRLAGLIERRAVDIVTFASSSAVDALARFLSADTARNSRFACIGPVTASTLRRRGLDVWVEATDHTDEGLVRAIVEASR